MKTPIRRNKTKRKLIESGELNSIAGDIAEKIVCISVFADTPNAEKTTASESESKEQQYTVNKKVNFETTIPELSAFTEKKESIQSVWQDLSSFSGTDKTTTNQIIRNFSGVGAVFEEIERIAKTIAYSFKAMRQRMEEALAAPGGNTALVSTAAESYDKKMQKEHGGFFKLHSRNPAPIEKLSNSETPVPLKTTDREIEAQSDKAPKGKPQIFAMGNAVSVNTSAREKTVSGKPTAEVKNQDQFEHVRVRKNSFSGMTKTGEVQYQLPNDTNVPIPTTADFHGQGSGFKRRMKIGFDHNERMADFTTQDNPARPVQQGEKTGNGPSSQIIAVTKEIASMMQVRTGAVQTGSVQKTAIENYMKQIYTTLNKIKSDVDIIKDI